ncbi:5'-nucleotidase, cytosolic IAa isoform X2 [Dunckerocampus dactyliophorus]|uniref:5'-nucleotidase, cytosolic IAa isoform X2 n=1 Tax=Dunckerocampus dactyliophorus TaxID=161453 RepID=UPI00240770A0|nr:5'-nucleotidase, cytosolic IAa isoform X2 [Dunckerocampus dactyliophorus]
MVKMSRDPVQVISGQVKELQVSSNGDNRAPWEETQEFSQDHPGLAAKPKPPKPENAVTVAVSTRVLFRTEREQKVFEQHGVEEYLRYQIEHENEPFAPGPAFPFVKALEAVNAQLRELYPQSEELFDIVLVTYNHAHVGIRLINTINHHNLFIERFCMTGGSSPIGYLKAWHTNLYLSADADKVREALAEAPQDNILTSAMFRPCGENSTHDQTPQGIAAATMFMPDKLTEVSESQLRVAFDGDAVLFSDESERIFKAHGLDKFFEHERENEDTLLDHGPLKGFLEALGKLQKKFYAKGQRLDCPIRTFLVTARSAASSGIRALKTLRAWGLEIDEALFLAGAPKGPMLEKIRPHIYFDDQMFHVEGAAEMGTVAAHVPYGIAQKHNARDISGVGK